MSDPLQNNDNPLQDQVNKIMEQENQILDKNVKELLKRNGLTLEDVLSGNLNKKGFALLSESNAEDFMSTEENSQQITHKFTLAKYIDTQEIVIKRTWQDQKAINNGTPQDIEPIPENS